MRAQPWIGKPLTDILFILSPPFLSLAVIALFPGLFRDSKDLPDAAWVVLILLIDVAHVYSTLYRTYLDPQAMGTQRYLLWAIPFAGFVAGVLIYSMSDLWFWRILAYIAVFHFVRQQYGFMRIYSRKEQQHALERRIDAVTIYSAALYPLLYWHLKGPRNFSWFIEEDFIFINAASLMPLFTGCYVLVLAVYLVKELRRMLRGSSFNFPKNMVIIGTVLSWYFGIVYFNGDMAFTLLNVVSHGVPYMALVWIQGKRSAAGSHNTIMNLVFSRYGVIVFLGIIMVLAFIEEGLWDAFLWKEHQRVFGAGLIPELHLDKATLSLLVPLLALPQITHYIMDGFIWKVKKLSQ